MRRDWKYVAFLIATFIVYLVVKVMSPRELDWRVTYHPNDTNPYGAYALSELMGSAFQVPIERSNLTFYELLDTLPNPVACLSLSTTFDPGDRDVQAILRAVDQGSTALIAANYFPGGFSDTLNISTTDIFFSSQFIQHAADPNDSSKLSVIDSGSGMDTGFVYPRNNTHNYFNRYDSVRATVLARNDLGFPVTLGMRLGKGTLILNSTPMAFANIHLLDGCNSKFIEDHLVYLTGTPLYWTEYYHLGRLEATTPLRFILSNEPLRWAYYLTIATLVFFVLFETRRRQRIIPLIKPLANTSLQFIYTIGNMHYRGGDHRNIAEKRINHLLEVIRTRFRLSTHQTDDAFLEHLAHRSRVKKPVIEELFSAIQSVRSRSTTSDEALKQLSKKIDEFLFLAR